MGVCTRLHLLLGVGAAPGQGGYDDVTEVAGADAADVQHPGGGMGSKRADLLREPCTILWDVSWEELMTVELKEGKDDPSDAPPSRLVLHLRDWSPDSRLFDTKQIARVVVCHPGTTQALEVRDAVQKAMDKYGPDRATVAALVRVSPEVTLCPA